MKKVFLFAATAAMMLASCSDEVTLTQSDVQNQAENAPQAVQFGTYLGKQGTTRAGTEGTMTTSTLKTSGFGVFAYFTGNDSYNKYQYDEGSGTPANFQTKAPNFMYNQKVSGESWTYSPIKYWPNDFANGTAVDKQTTAAIGSSEYGGNVSFFAYAPYVSAGSGSDGITAISANTDNGDPVITYTIPTDINTGGGFVDLLWGTLDGTTTNVLGSGNAGAIGTNTSSVADPIRPTTNAYTANLLNGYKTNVDLTKQEVDGKVGFSFKHALATFGGGTSNTIGLLAQLDIDNGSAITGGTREKFKTSGSGEDDAWRTIVTIKDITITNDLDGSTAINSDEVGLGGSNTFNLALGRWGNATSTGVYTQTIGVGSYNAVLNSKLAEIKTGATTWFQSLVSPNTYSYFAFTNAENAESSHPGVMESPINVYNDANQSPLVLWPGTTPKFKITVDYIVRTYDSNLSAACSVVEQKITKTIAFTNAVELNKKYSLVMHLGLTGVKFSATVADWVTDFDGDSDISDDYEIINLPLNVVE